MSRQSSVTPNDLRTAIREIFSTRALAAQQSEYDRTVCIRAVATAREVFEQVPVKRDVQAYGRAVLAALGSLYESYSDPDGEFTNGRASIGDAYSDVYALVECP